MNSQIELEMKLYDVSARTDGQPQCQTSQPFAGAEQLTAERNAPPPAATLETDFFLLDGSLEPFPDRPEQYRWGLWSRAQSGPNRQFAVPPVLRIDFAQSHSSVGITLHFDTARQDWCSRLRVAWLDRVGNPLSVREFTPQQPVAFLFNKVEDYYGLQFTFYETHRPGRYLKIEAIDYGLLMQLSGNDITAARLLEESDLSGGTVSVNTLEFTLHAADGRFSPLNPAGVFSVLQQGQQLELYRVGTDGRDYLGRYYLERWESGGKNDICMMGCDGVGLLERAPFLGGIYQGITAASLAEEIFAAAGLTYQLEETLGRQLLWGYIAPGTARQALWQLAFAAGWVVDSSRSDRIRLLPPAQRPSRMIGNDRKFLGQTIVQKPVVTGVQVAAHRYQPTDELSVPFEDSLAAGEYTVAFHEPLHSLTVEGAVLLAQGAGFARLRVDRPGPVKLEGRRYKDMVQQFSRSIPGAGANRAEQLLQVTNATLVSPQTVTPLLERLCDYYSYRYQTEFSAVLGQEVVGDMVSVRSIQGENLKGMVERLEIDLVRGCVAKMRLTANRVESRSRAYAGQLRAGEEWLV